jgi:hypothetical protein
MECSQIRKLLSEYMDGMLDKETTGVVEKHLETCKDCREELASLRAISEELGSLEAVEPPADFLKKVHERIEQRSLVSRVFRGIFIPTRLKIPFQLATAAAMAVLVFSLFNIIQSEKQIVGVPFQSEKARVEKPPATDSLEPAPVGPTHRAQPTLQKAVMPEKLAEREPIELVLLLKREAPSTVYSPGEGSDAEDVETVTGALEKEKPSAAQTLPGRRAKQTAPKAESTTALTDEIRQPPVPPNEKFVGSKDVEAGKSPSSLQALSELHRLVELEGGRVLADADEELGPPQYLFAEIPAKNYRSFSDKVGRLGVLRSSPSAIPLEDLEMIQVRIRLIPAP